MSKRDYLTVAELNFYINNVFLEEELLHNVPVVGEVSGCSVVGGHCYFTLKDEKSQIKVCYFNCDGQYIPHNGEEILVRGSVDYYTKNGQLSVKAYEIKPFGLGLLYAKLEELRNKLEEEGLFREDHKKEIPLYPKSVAIITSVKGAAVQDFITTVRKKNHIIDITVIDVRVQGEYAVNDIVTALNNADDYGFDIIVLARGGGSTEDLFVFNDERIVRKLYEMNTPTISAIGHDTDYSLCDYVADRRAITPTASGEIVGFDVKLLKNEILDAIQNIADEVSDNYEYKAKRIVSNAQNINHIANLTFNNCHNKVMEKCRLMQLYESNAFQSKNAYLESLLGKLDTLSPIELLKKGYFRILKQNRIIESIKEMNIGDDIKIIGNDGMATAKVVNKEDRI